MGLLKALALAGAIKGIVTKDKGATVSGVTKPKDVGSQATKKALRPGPKPLSPGEIRSRRRR